MTGRRPVEALSGQAPRRAAGPGPEIVAVVLSIVWIVAIVAVLPGLAAVGVVGGAAPGATPALTRSPAATRAVTELERSLAAAIQLNRRLALVGSDLEALLAIEIPSPSEIAIRLRTLLIDLRNAAGIAARLASEPAGRPAAVRLTRLYDSLSAVAKETLDVPVSNAPVYVQAAKDVVALLEAGRPLDADLAALLETIQASSGLPAPGASAGPTAPASDPLLDGRTPVAPTQ